MMKELQALETAFINIEELDRFEKFNRIYYKLKFIKFYNLRYKIAYKLAQ